MTDKLTIYIDMTEEELLLAEDECLAATGMTTEALRAHIAETLKGVKWTTF